MILQPNGNFHLTPGEVITVTVTAVNTMYLAIFSDLLVADWDRVQPPQVSGPNQASETRRFRASTTAPAREAFTILFDFVHNPGQIVPTTAQYIVDVRGTVGVPVRVPIPPVPPFPLDQQFVFEVSL
jgi:hypothetical protein